MQDILSHSLIVGEGVLVPVLYIIVPPVALVIIITVLQFSFLIYIITPRSDCNPPTFDEEQKETEEGDDSVAPTTCTDKSDRCANYAAYAACGPRDPTLVLIFSSAIITLLSGQKETIK